MSNRKEDICPNCGTECYATDVFCPGCGEDLDELFEQLPATADFSATLEALSRQFAFLNWLAPLAVIISPIVVVLVEARNWILAWDQNSIHRNPDLLIADIFSGSLTPYLWSFLLLGAVALYLCSIVRIRGRNGSRLSSGIAVFLSAVISIFLWPALAEIYIHTVISFASQIGMEIFLPAPAWVEFIALGCICLIALNLATLIQRGKGFGKPSSVLDPRLD